MQSAPPEERNSFLGNVARGMGERTLDLIAGGVLTADTVAQYLDPRARARQDVPDRLLQRAAGWLQDVDLGYDPRASTTATMARC